MLREFFEKIYSGSENPDDKIEETPREVRAVSPGERYASSPQEAVLEQRDFEREGKLLGGNVGSARFVKIRDDGGVFLNPIPVMREKKESVLQQKKGRPIW